jgi:hypothetical protein
MIALLRQGRATGPCGRHPGQPSAFNYTPKPRQVFFNERFESACRKPKSNSPTESGDAECNIEGHSKPTFKRVPMASATLGQRIVGPA